MDVYRKEYKYIVDDAVLKEVRNRIESLMKIDFHQKGDHYTIRSIYLDGPDFPCLRENEGGFSTRQKLRIRTYNCDSGKISAEIKIRHRDTISKMSADISGRTLDAIICGNISDTAKYLMEDMNLAANQPERKKKALGIYLSKIVGEGYLPAAMVNYERCAYVHPIGNVRITFDRNIEATRNYQGFFDEYLPAVPVIGGGKHVLEVKYDEFLPDTISEMLGGILPVRSSVSKYARCVYALGGVID